jgi:hypothetical protein
LLLDNSVQPFRKLKPSMGRCTGQCTCNCIRKNERYGYG